MRRSSYVLYTRIYVYIKGCQPLINHVPLVLNGPEPLLTHSTQHRIKSKPI